jgi:O-antigen/teichoic acid export membrane protein
MHKKNYVVITKAFIYSLFGNAMFFLAGIFLSRHLGAADYGDYAVAVTNVQIAYVLCILGLDKLAMREVPKFVHLKRRGLLRGFVTKSAQIILLGGVTMSVFLLIIYVLYLKYFPGATSHPVFITLAFLPFIAISTFFSRMLTAFNRFLLSVILYRIFIPFALLIGIIVVEYVHLLSSESAALVYCMTWVVSFFLYLLLLKKDLNKAWEAKPVTKTRTWIHSALPFLINSLMLILMNQIGIVLLEALPVDEAFPGIYAAVISIANFAILLINLNNEYFAAHLSPAFLEGEQTVHTLLRHQRNLHIVIAIAIALAVSLFGEKILLLFGKDFLVGLPALYVIAVGLIINLCLNLYPTILQYIGYAKMVSFNYLLLSSSTIGLSFFLIPYYGVTGAAWGVTIPSSIFFIFHYIYGKIALKQFFKHKVNFFEDTL